MLGTANPICSSCKVTLGKADQPIDRCMLCDTMYCTPCREKCTDEHHRSIHNVSNILKKRAIILITADLVDDAIATLYMNDKLTKMIGR